MPNLESTLKDAIDNYFAKKFHDGTGWWKAGEKDPAIQLIRDVCLSLGHGWEITPGLIGIHIMEGSIWFDRDNLKDGGKFVPFGEKTPLDEFAELVKNRR